jgi:ATP-binding cassette subfamily F protein 3
MALDGTLVYQAHALAACPQVRLAIFSQHHVDGMDLALSPLAAMKAAYPGVKASTLCGFSSSSSSSSSLHFQLSPMWFGWLN